MSLEARKFVKNGKGMEETEKPVSLALSAVDARKTKQRKMKEKKQSHSVILECACGNGKRNAVGREQFGKETEHATQGR